MERAREVQTRKKVVSLRPVLKSRKYIERILEEFIQSFTWKKHHVGVVKVDPEFAAHILSRNNGNRSLRKYDVAKYSSDMQNGMWKFNPADTLIIDWDCIPRNGQHRMHAVIDSDTTQEFILVTGVDPATVHIIDNGRGRTLADSLNFDNEMYPSVLSTCITWYHKYKTRSLKCPLAKLSFLESKAFLNENPYLRIASTYIGKNRTMVKNLCRTGTAATAFAIFYDINKKMTKQFFDGFVTGADLKKGSPILAIKNKFLLKDYDCLKGRSRMQTSDYLAYIVKAWNAFREDQKMTHKDLTWNPKGKKPEKFPTAI